MNLDHLSREQLVDMLADAAKLWLAHDGLWFQAVEKHHDMEHAIQLDGEAWQRFTVIEAKRIMQRHHIAPGGGVPALAKALSLRLYAYINEQEILEQDEKHLLFRMNKCRVQSARQRKGLPDFPCKNVGIIEYSGFAKTIDPRFATRCVYCPPDKHPAKASCAWEFILNEDDDDNSGA